MNKVENGRSGLDGLQGLPNNSSRIQRADSTKRWNLCRFSPTEPKPEVPVTS